MTSTPTIGATHVTAAQTNKYLTINAALDKLDNALFAKEDIDCSAGGNVAVSAAILQENGYINLTGSPAGAFNLDMGAVNRWVLIRNGSGQAATVRAGTPSATVVVANDTLALVAIQTNNVYTLASSGGSYTDEAARDAVAAMIAAGTHVGLMITHDDAANTLSFAAQGNSDYQESVLVATDSSDGNITLNGEYTLQGVALVDGDRVLATAQTTAADNRIWVVRAAADWDIADGWDTVDTVTSGTIVPVDDGDNAGKIFQLLTTGTIVLGTTALTWDTDSSAAVVEYTNRNVSSAAYTILASDKFKWLYMTRNGNQTFTLEEYAVQPMTNGSTFVVQWFGGASATKTVTADAAVTLNGTAGGSITLSNRYDAYLFKQKSRNVWVAVPWAQSSVTQEVIEDYVAAMFTGGTHSGISFSYDDTGGFVNATSTGGFTQEQIEDFIGLMVTGNTETRITVTYDDAGGKFDFVVAKDRQVWEYAISDETTSITTGTAKLTVRAPFAGTIADIKASLSVAGSTASLIDVQKNGTSIMTTNKLSFDASEKTTRTAVTAPTLTTTSVAEDDELTFEIVTAGTGAKGAKVYIYVDPT